MALKKGDKAPQFELPGSSGRNFNLASELKNGYLIVYFYPKDFTGGCTEEACSFRDNFSQFMGLDIKVVGISRDDVETHERFINLHKLPFELLSDTTGQVCKAYDALIPILKLPRRITYLIAPDGTIAHTYENMFNAKSHINEVLAQLTPAKDEL